MVQPLALATARLLLRQWRQSDRDPFSALCADPKVMEFLSSARDRATSAAAIERWSNRIQEVGWGFWAIEHRGRGEFLGFAGLQVPAEGHPYLPCVEIGWRLAAEYWGHGYASESAQAVLRVAFAELALPEVIATTAAGNRRSSAVMHRIGMRGPEATFQHPGVSEGNPLRTHILYRITREQWAQNAA